MLTNWFKLDPYLMSITALNSHPIYQFTNQFELNKTKVVKNLLSRMRKWKKNSVNLTKPTLNINSNALVEGSTIAILPITQFLFSRFIFYYKTHL